MRHRFAPGEAVQTPYGKGVVLEVRKDLCARLPFFHHCLDAAHRIENGPHVRIAVFAATLRTVGNQF